MNNENRLVVVKALKTTSYFLLVAGLLMLLPFPLFGLLKIIFRAQGMKLSPGHAFMMFLLAGQIVLCLPIFGIPIASLWVLRRTGSHDDKFHVLTRGLFRYSPALALGFAQMVYSAVTYSFNVPGVFGALLIVYSLFLLRIDGSEPSVKTR